MGGEGCGEVQPAIMGGEARKREWLTGLEGGLPLLPVGDGAGCCCCCCALATFPVLFAPLPPLDMSLVVLNFLCCSSMTHSGLIPARMHLSYLHF